VLVHSVFKHQDTNKSTNCPNIRESELRLKVLYMKDRTHETKATRLDRNEKQDIRIYNLFTSDCRSDRSDVSTLARLKRTV